MRATTYWLSTFVWDLFTALFPVTISFILFACFQVEGYRDEGLAAVLVIFVSLPRIHSSVFEVSKHAYMLS